MGWDTSLRGTACNLVQPRWFSNPLTDEPYRSAIDALCAISCGFYWVTSTGAVAQKWEPSAMDSPDSQRRKEDVPAIYATQHLPSQNP